MILWTLVLSAQPVVAADKLDVVHLKNGDRLTCDIKRLDRSLLTIATDPLGKVSVHWGEVTTLTSPRYFDVQLASGRHYYGSLHAAAPGQISLATGGGTITLALSDLIRLAPIGQSVWGRIDGSLDAGFSFAQANLETRWILNGTATYRGLRYQLKTTISSELTTSEDESRTFRNNLGMAGNRSFGNRWYTTAWGTLQQNEELSLDVRGVGGAGIGRDLVHTGRRLWSAFTGLAYTHEAFSDEPGAQSIEAAVGGQLDFFTPGSDDFRVTNSVISYFNVSGRSRVRLELQSAWRHEFFKDFYWSLNGFDSFDSDPPEERKQNDSGVSLMLGWKF